ncbi:MAG: 2Fe-2S iron-sulfur cluster-binding protein [Candidatus Absconditicoccaceae bacterium]
MVVKVKINDSNGVLVGEFNGEDNISFSKMASKNNIDIPVSCGMGACFACACKIVSGGEFIDIGKISVPLVDLPVDEKGNYQDVLTCVGGIKSEFLKDQGTHEIIIQKMI